jgi:hypothetical protein
MARLIAGTNVFADFGRDAGRQTNTALGVGAA